MPALLLGTAVGMLFERRHERRLARKRRERMIDALRHPVVVAKDAIAPRIPVL